MNKRERTRLEKEVDEEFMKMTKEELLAQFDEENEFVVRPKKKRRIK